MPKTNSEFGLDGWRELMGKPGPHMNVNQEYYPN